MSRTVGFFKTLIVVAASVLFGCANTNVTTGSTPSNPSLTGEWQVVDQSISKLMVKPNCKEIQKGSSFKFSATLFEVYPDASKKTCESFTYKTSNNTISFIKSDMIWLCTYELKENELTLFSDHFFIPQESNDPEPNNAKPSTTRIVVTLKKTSKTN